MSAWAAGVAAAEGAKPPLRQRPLTFDVTPAPPRPEDAARGDARFATAARVTAARQGASLAAALLAAATLAALYLSPLARRVNGVGARSAVAGAWWAAAAAAAVAAAWWAAAAAATALVAGNAAAVPLADVLTHAACWAAGAFALTFAVQAERTLWPQLWWLVVASAVVVAGVAAVVLRPWPPYFAPARPAAGVLAERAAYLADENQTPAYRVCVLRAGGRADLASWTSASRRLVVVTPAAQGLSRYEAEVMLATAIARGGGYRRAPLWPAALVALLLSLLAAEKGERAAAARLARRRPARPPGELGRPDAPPAAARPWLWTAAFTAAWLVLTPLFFAWNRHFLLAVDADVIRRTRKPLVAVAWYYREAAANSVAAEPNPVLHFLCDAEPSPAERAAQARRLRVELGR